MILDHIDNLIHEELEKNRDSLQRESLSSIHPEIHTSYNSINILVGGQGKGKSLTAWQQIIKIGAISPITHLVIYITKSGVPNDQTFDALKKLIPVPVVYISNKQAEKYVTEILGYKKLYNTVISDHLQDKIEETQISELLSALKISDLSLHWLHTIIYFEDSANHPLFKNPRMYFPQLCATCRHIGCSFYFAVQFWKSLPTELKANATTVFIFSGYSSEQLAYIFRQVPKKYPFKQIYAAYQKLLKHGRMIVSVETGDIDFDNS
jgi:hypothetical protein